MLDLSVDHLRRYRGLLGEGKILYVSAPGADEMTVRADLPVIAGTADVVEPVQETMIREIVQDPVDALARHGRQGLLNRLPDLVHVRMREILADERKYSQPLGRAFPAERPADFPELLVYRRVHFTSNTQLSVECRLI
jgi:hypothetical protein